MSLLLYQSSLPHRRLGPLPEVTVLLRSISFDPCFLSERRMSGARDEQNPLPKGALKPGGGFLIPTLMVSPLLMPFVTFMPDPRPA